MANKTPEMVETALFQNRLDKIVGEKKTTTKRFEDQDQKLVQQRKENEKISPRFKDLTSQLQKKLEECCKLEYSLERTKGMQMEALLHARNLHFLEMESGFKKVGPREEAEENRRNEKIVDCLKGYFMKHCNQILQREQVGECNWTQGILEKKFSDVEVPYIDPGELMKEVKVIEVLGVGGNGRAELVSHKGRLCVLKTAIRGKIDTIELQIMSHLDGVGGAPKLLAAAEDRFLCSFVGDQSLEDLVHNETVSQDFLMRAVRKVAERVGEIHRKSVSHNDIKANNIMYDPAKGEFNIIDFGLSCRMGDALYEVEDPGEYTRINWQAPEVKKGQRITGKSDVFSLGVLLRFVVFLFEAPDATALSLAGRATAEEPSDRPDLKEFIDILKWAEDSPIFRNKYLGFGNAYANIADDVILCYGKVNGLVSYTLENFEEECTTNLQFQDWLIPFDAGEDGNDWIEDWGNFSGDDWGKF